MIILIILPLVFGDVYMHNPRGSNDRNCERNVNRNNGNLCFDSQNNAKGGYACPRAVSNINRDFPKYGVTPSMRYVTGSKLEVEWTSQHGCGYRREQAASAAGALQESVHCETTLQLLCTQTSDPLGHYGTIFDGTKPAVPRNGIPNSDADSATNRIQTNDPGQAAAPTPTSNNNRYHVHETPAWYNSCNRRRRNLGLFTADQNVNRRSSIGTRQNPNGGRRGLECPEERDYFPYWHPNPFLDVAYLVSDPERCGVDRTSTQGQALLNGISCGGNGVTGNNRCASSNNLKIGEKDWVGNVQGYADASKGNATGRWHYDCVLSGATFEDPKATDLDVSKNIQGQIPKTATGLTPNAARNAFNARRWPNNKVDCDALNGDQTPAKYVWKAFPFTNGFEALGVNKKVADVQNDGPECAVVDWSRANHLGNAGQNDEANRYTWTIPDIIKTNENEESCILRLRYNMSSSDYARDLNASSNQDNNANPAVQSPIQQDPIVKVGPGTTDYVELALNTNQVSRTFQDRSYVFLIVKPNATNDAGCTEIININVRGKRGNIVQTFPAVEYDFIPNQVVVDCGIGSEVCFHFQWTGSDYNPKRGCNDANGGPYTGDRAVGATLTAATQGSNQNSRCDRNNILVTGMGSFTLGNTKNFPLLPVEADAIMGPNNFVGTQTVDGKGVWKDDAQAKLFAYGYCTEQLGFDTAKDHYVYGPLLPNALQPLTKDQMEAINNDNRRENHPRNCGWANALVPYFLTETVRLGTTEKGPITFLNTRNNNFSNRESKVTVICAGPSGGTVAAGPGGTNIAAAISSFKASAFQMPDEESAAYVTEMEFDKPPFDPVENDNYGDGQKEGCTQESLFFGGAVTLLPGFAMLTAFFTFF